MRHHFGRVSRIVLPPPSDQTAHGHINLVVVNASSVDQNVQDMRREHLEEIIFTIPHAYAHPFPPVGGFCLIIHQLDFVVHHHVVFPGDVRLISQYIRLLQQHPLNSQQQSTPPSQPLQDHPNLQMVDALGDDMMNDEEDHVVCGDGGVDVIHAALSCCSPSQQRQQNSSLTPPQQSPLREAVAAQFDTTKFLRDQHIVAVLNSISPPGPPYVKFDKNQQYSTENYKYACKICTDDLVEFRHECGVRGQTGKTFPPWDYVRSCDLANCFLKWAEQLLRNGAQLNLFDSIWQQQITTTFHNLLDQITDARRDMLKMYHPAQNDVLTLESVPFEFKTIISSKQTQVVHLIYLTTIHLTFDDNTTIGIPYLGKRSVGSTCDGEAVWGCKEVLGHGLSLNISDTTTTNDHDLVFSITNRALSAVAKSKTDNTFIYLGSGKLFVRILRCLAALGKSGGLKHKVVVSHQVLCISNYYDLNVFIENIYLRHIEQKKRRGDVFNIMWKNGPIPDPAN